MITAVTFGSENKYKFLLINFPFLQIIINLFINLIIWLILDVIILNLKLNLDMDAVSRKPRIH